MPSSKILGVLSGRDDSSDEQSTAPFVVDEMGNEVEAFEVWYCHSACVPADMWPSIDPQITQGGAERMAKQRRADASTWACVYVTGPHIHYRPKKAAIKAGPRVGTAADLGCEVL